MIKYFVSYFYVNNDGVHGLGSALWQREKPITDLDSFDEFIKYNKEHNNLKDIVILNWRRFEEYE